MYVNKIGVILISNIFKTQTEIKSFSDSHRDLPTIKLSCWTIGGTSMFSSSGTISWMRNECGSITLPFFLCKWTMSNAFVIFIGISAKFVVKLLFIGLNTIQGHKTRRIPPKKTQWFWTTNRNGILNLQLAITACISLWNRCKQATCWWWKKSCTCW